jgi:hypothetical protein
VQRRGSIVEREEGQVLLEQRAIRTLAEGGLAEPDEPAVTLGSVSEPLLNSRHLREVKLELLRTWPGPGRLLVRAPSPVSAWMSQSSTPVQFDIEPLGSAAAERMLVGMHGASFVEPVQANTMNGSWRG